MDFPGVRYYKFSQILLIMLGLWPYNNNSMLKLIQRIFCILLLGFSICLQVGKIIITSNFEAIFRILTFAIPCLGFSLKYATFCIKSKDIQKLIEQTKFNWIITKRKEEIEILHHYSYAGYLITVSISIAFYTFIFLFLLMQLIPKILDLAIPLNESRPCKLFGLATYFFDENEHFVAIFVHMTVAILLEATTIIATETACLIYIQHSSALFKIASFRIKHIFNYKLHIPDSDKNVIIHANIIDAIDSHNRAIEYFEFFNSCFGVSYFILLLLAICSVTVNTFHFFQVSSVRDVREMIASIIFLFCHFVYLFISNFLSQTVTDVSCDIFYATCNIPWYTLPTPLQKMVRFIMRRSIKNSKFTLCSMYDGSIQSFSSVSEISRNDAEYGKTIAGDKYKLVDDINIVNLCMSYFMVFWSMRN